MIYHGAAKSRTRFRRTQSAEDTITPQPLDIYSLPIFKAVSFSPLLVRSQNHVDDGVKRIFFPPNSV